MTVNAFFEDAIRVTPQGNNTYRANLRREWCIGTVPHGGYTTALIYKLAVTHFEYAHPKLYPTPATPISIQLSFLRRTAVGPITLEVEDVKLGARTSTIHIKLLQSSEKQKDLLEVKVAGYMTVSPASAEVGLSAQTRWQPYPKPAAGSLADSGVDLDKLARTGEDGLWRRMSSRYPNFRLAEGQFEMYGPGSGLEQHQRNGMMAIDQWMRFRPGGDQNGRWTDAAVVYLLDMFPMALDGLDTAAVEAAEANGDGSKAKSWYPTVTLSLDLKKRLPPGGVEWLYSRIDTKVVSNGRTDLNVTILDKDGEVVAMGSQVGLVVSASRNFGNRKAVTKL
ncbi:uncharacterized protein N7483_003171 [Penicillium malachiteum]|uniref:uncharacterized protein n=1 Tax=Penicillium malachiteum TaxID=1324776 RepID=UPI002546D7FB|nr:uncharacterized protein N7483_003171 [Penicillium malachiteum]KAJ5728663.1 hypothetical protein N7483_003171 [Penicillium malachiteum]